MRMRLLFVCTMCQNRSPTAAALFREEHETKCAGTDCWDHQVTSEALRWADIIFAMEEEHRDKLLSEFPDDLKGKRLVVLGIPDAYAYGDPELERLLLQKVGAALRRRKPA
jgi:predicted protein tyrosine phosphatase